MSGRNIGEIKGLLLLAPGGALDELEPAREFLHLGISRQNTLENRWRFHQPDVVDPRDRVLKVVVGGVFPPDQVAVGDQPAGLGVAVGIDHRFVGLRLGPIVECRHHCGLGEHAVVVELVVADP